MNTWSASSFISRLFVLGQEVGEEGCVVRVLHRPPNIEYVTVRRASDITVETALIREIELFLFFLAVGVSIM